jgi:general secretion pathway protein H
MPTSATGCCSPPAAARGFTLIELLVVLAIIGVLSVAVTLSISLSPRNAASADAERLALLLEAAALETQAGGRQLAWSAQAEGYSFWERVPRRDERWQAVTEDDRFGPQRLGGGLQVGRIEVEGQRLPDAGMLVFRRGSPPLFRIVLSAAGSGAQGKSIELHGTATGRVEVRTAGPS